MIAHLRGSVIEKSRDSLVVDVQGVGYEIVVAPSVLRRVGGGEPIALHVSESTAMYGGGTTLYGFLTREEKEIFLCLREHVPSTGAKKALEHLDKASKSLPDFRRAILEGDARILAGVFGFTQKTAERLVASLKDKLGGSTAARPLGSPVEMEMEPSRARTLQRALDALIALGYKPAEARQALQTAEAETRGESAPLEEMIRRSLKQLSSAAR